MIPSMFHVDQLQIGEMESHFEELDLKFYEHNNNILKLCQGFVSIDYKLAKWDHLVEESEAQACRDVVRKTFRENGCMNHWRRREKKTILFL